MNEDLRTRFEQLVDPLRPGVVIHGARLIELSTELGLRLRFEHRNEPLDIEVTPLPSPRRFALTTPHFGIGYRTEGDKLAVDSDTALKLCREVAKHLEASVFRSVQPPVSPRDAPRVREVQVQRLLERAGFGDQRFYTLSPYVGCVIGCRFCYAQSNLAPLRRWAGLPDVPWGSYVDARINAPGVLDAELGHLPARPIKFCPIVSDPYQAVESRYELTGKCLDVLARHECTTLLLTRSTLVLRDLERLKALNAWVGVSLPTADDEVRKQFEPRAASIDERVRILRTLKETGIRTFAVVQPMLPGPLDVLADLLVAHTQSVSLDILRGEEGAAGDFDLYPQTRSDAWQTTRARDLQSRLHAANVPTWTGELPPEL